MSVEVGMETNWKDKSTVYDGCTGEVYIDSSDGTQAMLAKSSGKLHVRDFGGGLVTVDPLTDEGKPAQRLVFEGLVNRTFNDYPNEVLVPGGPSGCGGGVGPETPEDPPDCGEKSIQLAFATLRYGEFTDELGHTTRNQLIFEEDRSLDPPDTPSSFTPYRNCAIWGPEGLLSFHDKLPLKAAFGRKKKLTVGGKTITREDADSESYSETTLEWEIILKRLKKK